MSLKKPWEQSLEEQFELIRANVGMFAPAVESHGVSIYLDHDNGLGRRLGSLPVEAVISNLILATRIVAHEQFRAEPMDPGFAQWVVWLIWVALDPLANQFEPKIAWTMYEGNPDIPMVRVDLQNEPWLGEMHGRYFARSLMAGELAEVRVLFERAWRVVYVTIVTLNNGLGVTALKKPERTPADALTSLGDQLGREETSEALEPLPVDPELLQPAAIATLRIYIAAAEKSPERLTSSEEVARELTGTGVLMSADRVRRDIVPVLAPLLERPPRGCRIRPSMMPMARRVLAAAAAR